MHYTETYDLKSDIWTFTDFDENGAVKVAIVTKTQTCFRTGKRPRTQVYSAVISSWTPTDARRNPIAATQTGPAITLGPTSMTTTGTMYAESNDATLNTSCGFF
jgi:hypothetical protein